MPGAHPSKVHYALCTVQCALCLCTLHFELCKRSPARHFALCTASIVTRQVGSRTNYPTTLHRTSSSMHASLHYSRVQASCWTNHLTLQRTYLHPLKCTHRKSIECWTVDTLDSRHIHSEVYCSRGCMKKPSVSLASIVCMNGFEDCQ